MKQNKSKTTRRAFLKQSAGLLALPAIVPSSVLGRDGSVPPSEKIIVGGIGIGSRGSHDLRWMIQEKDIQVVATCDLNRPRGLRAKKLADDHYGNKDCKLYHNMPEFLAERTDLDAVLITTGDRWHALASVLAMRAGKDVYSEKPSSMTVAEGQAVVDTALRYQRIYQTGTQRLSQGNFTSANELLRTGRLGKIHTVRAHIAPWDSAELRHDWLPAEPEPAKDVIDWDHWLGPCPWRPFNAAYCKGRWRGHYDFHTSCIGEWGAHTFAQCQVALGLAHTSAVKYHYVPNDSGDGMVTEFANGIKMVLERDMDKKYWRGSCGVRYEGDEGWVSVADGYVQPVASSPKMIEDFHKQVRDYQARTGRPMNHVRDFFDSVRSRRQPIADPVMMHRTMTTVHAANICMWLKRDMHFDPETERFINDPEANRLLSRAMREPWII